MSEFYCWYNKTAVRVRHGPLLLIRNQNIALRGAKI